MISVTIRTYGLFSPTRKQLITGRKKHVIFILLLILSSLFCFFPCRSIVAQTFDLMKGPVIQKKCQPSEFSDQSSTAKLVGKGLIHFYSTVISPADGPRSPSYPTGSAYGKQAIEKHGIILGVILTADRLIHESDVHLGAVTEIYGVKRYYDPVENNTFWWDSKKKEK